MIFQASKAALLSFSETMRAELPPEITITTATLGVIESEISKGKCVNGEGITKVNSESANVRYLGIEFHNDVKFLLLSTRMHS